MGGGQWTEMETYKELEKHIARDPDLGTQR